MKVVAEEAFAPIANVIACDDFEEALRQADATPFGLQVGVFTRDINRVFQRDQAFEFRRRDHQRYARFQSRSHALRRQSAERAGA